MIGRREDTFSTNIEAAAWLERMNSTWQPLDDRPSESDLAWDERDAAQDDPEDER